MQNRQRRIDLATLTGLALLAACFTACGGPAKKDIDELKTQQRQILAKLAEIEKKIESGSPARRAAARGRTGPDPNEVYELPIGDSPTRGPNDAPVTIVEFSDYQCPFCARSEPLIKSVLAEYPDQVRFVYKQLPLTSIHPYALGAAQAAVAAQKQGKFWEMHDLLFANQRALQPENLKSYARQLGLDARRFESDMASPETKAAVQEDVRLSHKVGVRGTPTIFVNGKLLQQRSLDGMKAVIAPLLKDKANG